MSLQLTRSSRYSLTSWLFPTSLELQPSKAKTCLSSYRRRQFHLLFGPTCPAYNISVPAACPLGSATAGPHSRAHFYIHQGKDYWGGVCVYLRAHVPQCTGHGSAGPSPHTDHSLMMQSRFRVPSSFLWGGIVQQTKEQPILKPQNRYNSQYGGFYEAWI